MRMTDLVPDAPRPEEPGRWKRDATASHHRLRPSAPQPVPQSQLSPEMVNEPLASLLHKYLIPLPATWALDVISERSAGGIFEAMIGEGAYHA